MTAGSRWAGSSREDELLSRLYQHVTEQQAARFGGGYDIAAALDRYQAWLREHAAEEKAGREAIRAGTVMAMHAGPAGIGAISAVPGLGEAVTADPVGGTPAGTGSHTPGAGAGWDAGQAVTALYGMHYRSLVRLAAMLVHDMPTAEELVQDSFVALHAIWPRLADSDRALSYLRQSVVNRSRSALRHRVVVDKLAPKLAPHIPGAAQEQITRLESSTVISALRALPARQREVLVLRYYADLSEAQIASTMGISKSAVKSHTARAMLSLRAELREMDE
jgi:RNA polymerase sigma-70 factor (sigma-E family)